MKSQKREWKNAPAAPKREEDNPVPSTTKTTSHPWKKMKPAAKNVEGKTQEKLQLLPKAPT